MRSRVKSGYGSERKTKHQQGKKKATEEKQEEQELENTRKKKTHVSIKSKCRHAEFVNRCTQEFREQQHAANKFRHASLPLPLTTNQSRALPSASCSWTVKAMLIFWNNRRAPFCTLRGGLSRFLYTETYLISIPVAPKLIALDRLPTATAMPTSH
jgi:hypothetical protein